MLDLYISGTLDPLIALTALQQLGLHYNFFTGIVLNWIHVIQFFTIELFFFFFTGGLAPFSGTLEPLNRLILLRFLNLNNNMLTGIEPVLVCII
jgi:hypothetical protein